MAMPDLRGKNRGVLMVGKQVLYHGKKIRIYGIRIVVKAHCIGRPTSQQAAMATSTRP
jgi:hypothetical protein